MSKKDFLGGLSSLIRDEDKPKVGRPKTSTRKINKSSQEGTKENETRATFVMKEDTVDKIKAIAYWERKMIKEVVEESFYEFIEKYEQENGKIKPIPNK
ncbi:MAG: hypothetical protein GX752_08390 [Clostridium sp.]|nr:hypothetical protein [Clostridium sp.]